MTNLNYFTIRLINFRHPEKEDRTEHICVLRKGYDINDLYITRADALAIQSELYILQRFWRLHSVEDRLKWMSDYSDYINDDFGDNTIAQEQE